MKQKADLNCPYCHGPAAIKRLDCSHCGVELSGNFQANEFAYLGSEDLHFLRIFLECEGKIKDMEGPLGLSYPTIRTRLTEFKEKVLRSKGVKPFIPPPEGEENPEPLKNTRESLQDALDALVKGAITYEEALNRIKRKKRERK